MEVDVAIILESAPRQVGLHRLAHDHMTVVQSCTASCIKASSLVRCFLESLVANVVQLVPTVRCSFVPT